MIGEIDRNLFLFLNGINSPFWDEVMWIISAKATWIPLYLFILWLFVRNHGRKTVVIILFVAAAITLSDQLSVHAFKDVFQRLRPCHEPDLEGLVHIVRGKCGGRYGFVSSHAANSFSIALFALLLLKRRWLSILLVSWALVVSYSRIYLGVHYPGDILGGAMLGSLTGWLLWYAYRYTESNMLNQIPWFRPGRRQ
ncbi:MAG: phosphatase PAP2 family protein [Bacteroidales bacterium]|jgi:undecaprenyl-diphosphatase|nr:phosphatase PAP2 family protein [Bacteroidales bacterium]